jgi:DNA processing protein
MEDSVRNRLRLIRSANIGPVTYRQLIARFGDAAAAIAALPDLAARGGGRAPRLADPARIDAELAGTAALGARHVFIDDGDYPALLAATDGAPAVLCVVGDLAMLDEPTVAIVGARNASAAAVRFARQLSADLAGRGLTIVSGLARGIDAAAHVGALAAGGRTAGMIASGIDVAFPPENAPLQARMAREQLVVSEYPPGTEPLARHFPARNRIIAGAALATLVIEAAPRSGSLITARLAGEFGREVLAVPGSPLDARAQGCNQLIRDGATLVQNADEVEEAVRPIDARRVRDARHRFAPMPSAEPSDDLRRDIASLLGPSPVAVDEIVRQAGCPAAEVAMVLLELELGGALERHAGGRVSRLM